MSCLERGSSPSARDRLAPTGGAPHKGFERSVPCGGRRMVARSLEPEGRPPPQAGPCASVSLPPVAKPHGRQANSPPPDAPRPPRRTARPRPRRSGPGLQTGRRRTRPCCRRSRGAAAPARRAARCACSRTRAAAGPADLHGCRRGSRRWRRDRLALAEGADACPGSGRNPVAIGVQAPAIVVRRPALQDGHQRHAADPGVQDRVKALDRRGLMATQRQSCGGSASRRSRRFIG